MDAIQYIRRFREAYAARDSVAARRLAGDLRREPWSTVALAASRLMGIGLGAPTEESAWHASHLTDVLVAAHAASK